MTILVIIVAQLLLSYTNFVVVNHIISLQDLSVQVFRSVGTVQSELDTQMIRDTLDEMEFSDNGRQHREIMTNITSIEASLGNYDQDPILNQSEIANIQEELAILVYMLSSTLDQRLRISQIIFLFMLIALILHFAVNLVFRQIHQKLVEDEQFSKKLIEATNSYRIDERNHIARLLHDSILQDMAGFYMNPEVGKSPIMKQSLNTITDRLRYIINSLDPLHLKTIGLKGALNDFIMQFKSSNLSIIINGDFDDNLLTYGIIYDLYISLQEIIINAGRYGHAARISIHFSRDESTFTVSIQNDGSGFNTLDSLMDLSDMGLSMGIIQYRFYLFGGDVSLDSSPDSGTSILMKIPINKAIT